jgi:putative nucleotidyltransferase with HDIG domain
MAAPGYGLKAFVYRKLVLRLGVACLVIAGLFGTGAYLIRYNVIGQAAVLQAVSGVERLATRVRTLAAESDTALAENIQRALDEEPVNHRIAPHGRFVFVRFYGTDGTRLAQRATPGDPEAGELRAFLRQLAPGFPPLDEPWYETAHIGGQPYIHVVLTVPDRNGKPVVYARGLYAPSDASLDSARRAAFATAGYVVLIVLVTSLVLYPVILKLMRRLAGFSEHLLNANLETIQVLGSAIARRDSDTDAHNYRVTLYAIHLAEAAGFDTDAMRALVKGAFLHDVGKIGIRDRILHKPGKLDEDEFRVMKTHVVQGLEIVQRSAWLTDAVDVIGSHHEKYDGSGYPKRLQGEAIPIGARIFAIVDVFDALTSRRPYKEPFSFDETMQILEQGRGTHFDPALLDLFGGMAKDLYTRYGGREDENLRTELKQHVRRFFSAGLDTLVY